MANNVGEKNMHVGVDCRVEMLEETFERFREEQQEQFWQIHASLMKVTLNVNNRKPEANRVHAKNFARGQPIDKYVLAINFG